MIDEIRDYLVAFKEQCEAEIEVGKDGLNDALAAASVCRLSKLIAAIDAGRITDLGEPVPMQATVLPTRLGS